MNEVQLTWFNLAQKTVEQLQEYDRKNGTTYACPFENSSLSLIVLGEAMSKADHSLMWKGIPHA